MPTRGTHDVVPLSCSCSTSHLVRGPARPGHSLACAVTLVGRAHLSSRCPPVSTTRVTRVAGLPGGTLRPFSRDSWTTLLTPHDWTLNTSVPSFRDPLSPTLVCTVPNLSSRASPQLAAATIGLPLSPPFGANWEAWDNHLGVAEPYTTSACKDRVCGGRNRSPEFMSAAATSLCRGTYHCAQNPGECPIL